MNSIRWPSSIGCLVVLDSEKRRARRRFYFGICSGSPPRVLNLKNQPRTSSRMPTRTNVIATTARVTVTVMFDTRRYFIISAPLCMCTLPSDVFLFWPEKIIVSAAHDEGMSPFTSSLFSYDISDRSRLTDVAFHYDNIKRAFLFRIKS